MCEGQRRRWLRSLIVTHAVRLSHLAAVESYHTLTQTHTRTHSLSLLLRLSPSLSVPTHISMIWLWGRLWLVIPFSLVWINTLFPSCKSKCVCVCMCVCLGVGVYVRLRMEERDIVTYEWNTYTKLVSFLFLYITHSRCSWWSKRWLTEVLRNTGEVNELTKFAAD